MHLLAPPAHEHELAHLANRMKPDKAVEPTLCEYIARYGRNKNTDAGVGQERLRETRKSASRKSASRKSMSRESASRRPESQCPETPASEVYVPLSHPDTKLRHLF